MSRIPFVLLIVFAMVFIETGNSQTMQCGPYEEFNSCGTACPPTCSVPQPLSCTANCVPGCECRAGYLRNGSGQCVLQSDCFKN